MGLYGFKPQFVPHILNGTKTHTIRAERRHPDKPGNTMHLYTGLRQKGARLLMRVPCVRVESIVIEAATVRDATKGYCPVLIFSGGDAYKRRDPLMVDEAEALAIRDGFADLREFERYWYGQLPFVGHVYHWDFERRTA